MQEGSRSQIDAVNPLIKIVKEREELYFQLLTFVTTHLSTSSYDLDNTTIFKKYILLFDTKHAAILKREQQLVDSLTDPFEEADAQDPITKQMLRLSSRLLEILQGSLSRAQNSVFDDCGRGLKEFNRFKSTLNKILKREYFLLKDFVQHIISYSTSKFNKQFLKLNKYLERVQLGDQIWFKEMYSMQLSDVEQSSEFKSKEEEKTVRKLHKKIDVEHHLSSNEERQKKGLSLRKTMKPATKRRQRLLNIKNKGKQAEGQEEQPDHHKKQRAANKLYKFYLLLDLNKKQFLEDYIYDNQEQQKHKNQLLGKLLQRNKAINWQINAFVKKSTNYQSIPMTNPAISKSSGDQTSQRNESASSKVSLKTSFIISKRKSTSHFDTSGNERASDNQKQEKDQLANTIKNLNPRRRSSHSNPRPQEKSKKIFVVKAPIMFEEEIIPQAQITQTQWLQAPLTMKGREKKTENIRLKRKNNVNPLQNAFLPQNIRYPF